MRDFAAQRRGLVVAAAGCGKTELIARAAGLPGTGRQLILTHTHAGVRALRDRLIRKHRVSPKRFRVETIAAFAYRLARAYPAISGCESAEPLTHEDFTATYDACLRVVLNRHVRDVLSVSYAGLFVDEYQDCTQRQHSLVLGLAEILPCRVVGDPLQGIFFFTKSDPLPDWRTEVIPEFDRLPPLKQPHRWKTTNPRLGQWLTDMRTELEAGRPVDLRHDAIQWVQTSHDSSAAQSLGVCKSKLGLPAVETVAAIHTIDNRAHYIAKNLRGAYQSMEEVDSRALKRLCTSIDSLRGAYRVGRVLSAACACMTSPPGRIKQLAAALVEGRLPRRGKALTECRDIVECARVAADGDGLAPVADMLAGISSLPDVTLFRRELYADIERTCRAYDGNPDEPLVATAGRIGNRRSMFGTRLPRRVITRTLLIKGLEFDHVVILDADGIQDRKNLYVALTRGSRSLTVLSSEPTVLAG